MSRGRLYVATKWYRVNRSNKSGRSKLHGDDDRWLWYPQAGRSPSLGDLRAPRTRVSQAALEVYEHINSLSRERQRQLHRLTFDVWDAPECRDRANKEVHLPPDLQL